MVWCNVIRRSLSCKFAVSDSLSVSVGLSKMTSVSICIRKNSRISANRPIYPRSHIRAPLESNCAERAASVSVLETSAAAAVAARDTWQSRYRRAVDTAYLTDTEWEVECERLRFRDCEMTIAQLLRHCYSLVLIIIIRRVDGTFAGSQTIITFAE